MLADDLADMYRDLADGLDSASNGHIDDACFFNSLGKPESGWRGYLALREIKRLSMCQQKEGLPGGLHGFVIVDRDVAGTDNLQPISGHEDRSTLIDPDSQQMGFGLDYFDHIKLTVAAEQMLIDSGVLQKSEAHLVIAHHLDVRLCVTADEIRTDEGRSRGIASHNTSAIQHGLNIRLH